jgi:hypothetical protein
MFFEIVSLPICPYSFFLLMGLTTTSQRSSEELERLLKNLHSESALTW